GFSPKKGAVGTQVIIAGSDFTGATAVSFGGVPATSFQITNSGATQMEATVPPKAATGPITVTTGEGTASFGSFTVTATVMSAGGSVKPVITSFSPAKGKIGTMVMLHGRNFT